MIDAYDVLGVDMDAEPEVVKRAYRRLCLQLHPDKARSSSVNSGDADAKFAALKAAYDVLQDADRRRAYDAFGFDFGEEKPENEVWTLGLSTLVSPMSIFTVKTAVALSARLLAGISVVKLTVLVSGIGVLILHRKSIHIRGLDLRAASSLPLLINLGVVWSLAILHWVWPLLFDATCIFYLTSEVSGVEVLVQGPRVFGSVGLACLIFARLARGRWQWVFGLQVLLLGITVLSCVVASIVLRHYVVNAKVQYGDKVRGNRLRLRRERQRLQEEAESLRRQLLLSRMRPK